MGLEIYPYSEEQLKYIKGIGNEILIIAQNIYILQERNNYYAIAKSKNASYEEYKFKDQEMIGSILKKVRGKRSEYYDCSIKINVRNENGIMSSEEIGVVYQKDKNNCNEEAVVQLYGIDFSYLTIDIERLGESLIKIKKGLEKMYEEMQIEVDRYDDPNDTQEKENRKSNSQETKKMDFKRFSKRIASAYKNNYDLYCDLLDMLRNGSFEALNFDPQLPNINEIEDKYENLNILYLICCGHFYRKDYKSCYEAFKLLYEMCFYDFNKLTDQQLQEKYEKGNGRFTRIIPTREDFINLFSSDNLMYFTQFENRLLHSFSESNDKYIQKIIELCASNPEEEVRAICCAIVNNPEMFANDPSERVRKVVDLRTSIDDKINNLSEPQKELIEYIIEAKEKQLFTICDGLLGFDNPSDMHVMIGFSPVFNGGYVGDRDIYWYMKDLRVIAYDMFLRILDGQIKFIEGKEPDCYKEIIKERNDLYIKKITRGV